MCPILLFVAIVSQAQTKTISGKILDEKGNSIVGASIVVKGGTVGTTTDATGHYKLNVPVGTTTVVVSYVGYASQDLDVTSSSDVTASLQPTNSNLTDIVVVGYGTARKKDLTGSVTSITSKNFNKGYITSPDELLQNKVPGLDITTNSGQPGVATTVKIRGNNSIRSGDGPLYVVDGVELDGRTARPSLDLGANGLPFGATPESNPLLYINPNDISQIDVLKDASSTAIYGSRGANGVIIITTKRATGGSTRVEFGSSFGFAAGYMKKYPLLSASEFRSQSKANSLNQDSGSSVDMMKEITQSTLSQNYNLSLSGGNETAKFRASFLGSATPGFVKNTSLDKYLGNIGGQFKFLDDRVTLDFDVIAGHTTEQIQLLTNTAGAGGNFLAWALNWNPTVALWKMVYGIITQQTLLEHLIR